MNTLLLTPLSIEFGVLTQFFLAQGWKHESLTLPPLTIVHFPEKNLYCAIGGHGKTQFALQTQFLLQSLKNISAVYCVGSSGALTEQTNITDVVIGTKTIEHDFQMKFRPKPSPTFTPNKNLLEKFRSSKSSEFKIHFAPIASGDEDVMDAQRAREIGQKTQALAVAWEGAGAARACQFHKIPFIEIRAITDNADKSTHLDFTKNLNQAMLNLCSVLLQTL